MEKEPVIVAKDLAGGYADRTIWSGANFSICRGEFAAVLGPNGAGKTTLFRMLLGLEKPRSGSLAILGEAPRKGNPRIGYVPQRHPIDSDTGIEALELVRLGIDGHKWGMGSSRKGREAAYDALRAVGAEELAHRSLGKLSGGELQRIFLAEALVGNPDLLLLDEPLANLDIRREADLVNLVARVVRTRNVTALLIAHNINSLLSSIDRVVYVANGHVATGAPKEVLNSQTLSGLYGTSVEVLTDSRGRIAVIGMDEPSPEHHHEAHHAGHHHA
jgi:zinc/manganese transport system ATP-binding protein